MMNEQKLINVFRLSERTCLPVAWLRRETDAGRIPCIRAGRHTLYDAAAVIRALSKASDRAKREEVSNAK
jgi:hypothetical protein